MAGQDPEAAVRPPPVWLLGAMSGLGLFASSMLLPSIPDMARDLHAAVSLAQATLTVSLAGMGASMLVVGFLSDRFGRLGVTYACAALMVLGSLVAWLAPGIVVLLVGRALQGLASGGLVVLGRAMLRDAYREDAAIQASASVSMTMAIAPIIAPPLGGLLQILLGWRASLACVLCISLLMLAVMLRQLDETHPPSRRLGRQLGVWRGYGVLMANRRFLAVTIPVALFSAGIFAFHTAAPVIMISVFGVTPGQYGFYATLPAFGFIAANLVTLRLRYRITPDAFIEAGFFGAMLAGATMVGAAWLLGPNPWCILVPAMMFTFSNGLMQSHAILASTSVVAGLIGASSAMANFLRMVGSSGGSLAAALGGWHSAAGIGAVYLLAAVGSLLAWKVLQGRTTPLPARS